MPTPFSLTTPLPESDLQFDSMQHSAGVSALEETQLFLLSDQAEIAPEQLLGQAVDVQIRLRDGALRLFIPAVDQPLGGFARVHGVLVADGVRGFEIDVPVKGAVLAQVAGAATVASIGLVAALALAFAGGLILNLMPCVLPVLSIKVLGFARGHSAQEMRAHGLHQRRTAFAAVQQPRKLAGVALLHRLGGALGGRKIGRELRRLRSLIEIGQRPFG